ncbi:hypothetical protein M9H77_19467 [Catharanthus roseus]|uniref:Uncharacterized protein n=1 Tax=Catharanthus roseus TaxID=4058 RepID=A0ACC0BAD2_CATRO|nr:hypothetical protein M9H77_19467 [Catharanthus roseus]
MEKDESGGFGPRIRSTEAEEGVGLGSQSESQSQLSDTRHDVAGNGNGDDEAEVKTGDVQHFHQSGTTPSQGIMELNLHLGLRDEPSSSSSSSLITTALDTEKCDREHLQNKRSKVDSFPLDWGSHLDNEICYLSHTCEDVGLDDLSAAGGTMKDEGNDNITTALEDSEVLMDLTDDLLHKVFSFLDYMDLCQASMVCRQWRAASSHEDLWHYLNFENRQISMQQFEDICCRYPNATSVNIYNTPNMHSLVMKAISSLRNLEVLILGKGKIAETFFQALTDCHMLRSLTINDATLGNDIQEIPIYHDRLRLLQVVGCLIFSRVSIRCPQLETLSLKFSIIPELALNSPLLRDLDIASCHISDAAIQSAAISSPLLESLNISNCWGVCDETLRNIALTCRNLHVLHASHCPNISLVSVRLPMLTILKLHSCERITSASMAAIAHSSILEVLELGNSSVLTSVSLDLPRLKKIRLVHCRKFVDLNLRCSMLSSITVSNCPALQRINITSSTLKKLVLQKQEKLTTLALECQSLEEVDLTECVSLTDSISEVFSDGGGCPVLKSLVLNRCESLTAVGLCSSSLISLSLAGCHAITSLELKCPYLEQVSLDGCDHLERTSFVPVGLRSLNLGIFPKLNALDIEAPQMVSLELTGCGVLSEASINCPLLTSLDASFCSQLKDDCLLATTASCPVIESLVLMSCPSVGSDGLLSLRWLPNLTYLDLSYTFLVNLQPIFKSCLHLKVTYSSTSFLLLS